MRKRPSRVDTLASDLSSAARRVTPRSFSKALIQKRLCLQEALTTISEGVRPAENRIHTLHKEVRAFRVEVRMLRRLTPIVQERELRSIGKWLGRLSNVLGALRDLDVINRLLTNRLQGSSKETQGRIKDWVNEIRSERARLRADLQRLATASLRHIEQAALGGVSELPAKAFRHRLLKLVSQADLEVTEALLKARKRPTVKSLHRLRIAIRRARLVRKAATHGSAGFPTPWIRLQHDLGLTHDQAILVDWAREKDMPRRDPPLFRHFYKRLGDLQRKSSNRIHDDALWP